MGKNSALTDQASIYEKREAKTEREKWDQMDKQQKWQYFKDYYILKLIILVLSVGFIGYVLYATLGPRDESVLYGMVFNDKLDEKQSKQSLSDFREALSIPAKRHPLTLDDSFTLNPENADVTTQQKITMNAMTGRLNVLISDEATIKYFAESGYLANLNEVLPSDFYKANTDGLIFAKQEQDTTELAYGLSLENSELYKQMSSNYQNATGKKMAIGIVVKSDKRDNAIKFVQYLFGKTIN